MNDRRPQWGAHAEQLLTEMRDAVYLERAERIAAAENPELELLAASFCDVCTAMAVPAIEGLLLSGEVASTPQPTSEEFATAWAEAIEINRRYLERVRGAA